MKFSAFVLATAAASTSGQFLGGGFSNVFNQFPGQGAGYPTQQFAYPQQQFNAYPMVQPQADPLAWERDCSWINSLNFRAALSRATCGVDVCVTQTPQGNGGGYKRTASATAEGFHVWGTVINRAGRVCAIAYTGADVTQQFPFGRIQSAKKANTANSLSLPTRAAPNHIAVPIETNAGFAHEWDFNGSHPGITTMNPHEWLSRKYVSAHAGFSQFQNSANSVNGLKLASANEGNYYFTETMKLAYGATSGTVAAPVGDGAASQSSHATNVAVSAIHGAQYLDETQLDTGASGRNNQWESPLFAYRFGGDAATNTYDGIALANAHLGWGAGGGVRVPSDRRALAGYPMRTNNVNDVDTKDDEHWSGFSMDMSPGNLAIHYQGAASNYGEACGNTRQDPMCMQKPGGYDYHAGGLALYDAQGVLRGAIGVAGDNDCANHAIAWKAREQLTMDFTPAASQADGFRESRRLYVGWMQPPNVLPATTQSAADHAAHFNNFFVRDPWQTWKKGNVGAKAEDNIAFHVRPLTMSASPPLTYIPYTAAGPAANNWGAAYMGSMYPGGGMGHDFGGIGDAGDLGNTGVGAVSNTRRNIGAAGATLQWISDAGAQMDNVGVLTHGLYGYNAKGEFPHYDQVNLSSNHMSGNGDFGNAPAAKAWNNAAVASDTYNTGGRHVTNPQATGIGRGWEHSFYVASISRAFGMEMVQDGDECTALPCEGVSKDNTKEWAPILGVNKTPFDKNVVVGTQSYGNYDWTQAHQGDGPYIYCAVMVSEFYTTNPTAVSVFSASK